MCSNRAAGPLGVPGRCWHYMVFCSRCGARPALPLPRGEALCRLHGGRLPAVAERWSRGASSAAGNIVLPARRPTVSEATRVAGLRLFRPGGG